MPDDLTPADDPVRRLLADARHAEPMPDEVAQRLDGVLVGLGEEREADGTVRPLRPHGSDLAAAHRRRNVRNWLAAAAAVVVVGLGANQVDWSGLSSSDGGDSASAGSADSAAEAAGPADQDGAAIRWQRAKLHLTEQDFGHEVRAFRINGADAGRTELYAGQHDTSTTRAESAAPSDYSPVCDVDGIGAGRLVPVRYEGERAWLVLRHPKGDSQVVELFLCGAEEPSRSITLSAK